jgi:ribosomal protein S12 methylthiotransferase
MPTLYLVSLGCSKNQVDSEALLGLLLPRGYSLCAEPEQADVLLVNTCAFIEPAREEAYEVISELINRKAGSGKLVVCGCLVNRADDTLKKTFPGVDAWVQIKDERNIFELVSAWFPVESDSSPVPRIRISPPHYAYLRIADGCNHRCSFCAIPAIRGGYTSLPVTDIVGEAARLVGEGVVELNVIAQDTSGYGRDLDSGQRLPELLDALCTIDGIQWIRLQYLYPATITDQLLDVMTRREKICRYVDLPLQHIADEVLKHMQRPGRAYTRELLGRIQERLPGVTMRTSMIVGYPAETTEHFEELKAFIAEGHFHHLGVFEYSHEEDTPAFSTSDRVPPGEKQRRREELMLVQQQVSFEKNQQAVGESTVVLLDECPGPGTAVGRRPGDAPDVDNLVHVTGAEGLPPGSIVPVRITRAEPYDLYGHAELDGIV